ncbi:hemagglutinin repeat-containing protein [Methylobacterium phyllostachyos]|uniref:hemagglutinin repeat-containing protein n=1 Tax=Methylobacterium phyllostachyos TaxID=582672 RepID=UPI000B1CCD4D|nr:hemagglutinin repeat-containing protein [Methylobacterium phyllostachyos]
MIEIADGFGNSGGLLSRSLALKAGGDFANSGQIGAVDDLTATVGGRVDNTGRLIAKDGDLSLTAGGLVASSGDIMAGGRLALTAAAYETPADTAKMGGADVVVRLGTGPLFNLGQLVAANALDIEAGDFGNGPAGRVAGKTIRLALTGSADNRGRIEATEDLALTTQNLANSGVILIGGAMALQIAGSFTNGGNLLVRSFKLRVGGDLANSGQIGAHDDLTVKVGGRIDNTGSLIAQDGDLGLTAGGVVASSGDIIAGGRLALTAAAYETPADTAKLGGADLVVRLGTGHLINLGGIVAANGLDVEAGDFGNGPIGRVAGTTIRLALTGATDNRGRIEATGDLAVSTLALLNSGEILANGAGKLEVAGALFNSGRILGRTFNLQVEGGLSNTVQIGAVDDLAIVAGGRVDNAGSLIALNGNLSLTAGGGVASSGDIVAGGRLALTAASYEVSADTAKTGGTEVVVRLGTGHLINLGQLVAVNSLDVEAGDFGNGPYGRLSGTSVRLDLSGTTDNRGRIEATGDLTLSAGSLTNSGSILANGAGKLQVAGALFNGGNILGRTLVMQVGSDLGNTDQIGALDALTVAVGGRIDNAGSLISQDGDLNLTAGGIVASSGNIIANKGRLALTAGGYEATAAFARTGGTEVVVRLGTGHLTNLGQLVAVNGLDVEAGDFANGPAGYLSGASIRLALTGAADNKGRIETIGDLAFSAGSLTSSGSILANNAGTIQVAGALSNSGSLVAKSLAVRAGGDLTNSNLIGSLTSLTVTAGGRVDNVSADADHVASLIAQDGDLNLTAGGIVASSGNIIANKGRLALTAGGYEATAAFARTGGTEVVVRLGSGHLTNLGQLVAVNGLDVEAGDFGNGPAGRLSGASIRLALTGAADNKGRIETAGDLALTTTNLTNSGVIVNGGALALQIAGSYINSGSLLSRAYTLNVGGDLVNNGQIGALDALTVAVGGRIDNAGSLIARDGDLNLTAGGIVASSGNIIAGGRLALTAGGYEATADAAKTGGTEVVVRLGTGHLSNLGQLVAANSLDVEAGNFANGSTGHLSGASIRLALTGAADNNGRIETTGDLALSAASLTNTNAILGNGLGNVQIAGLLSNKGSLKFSGNATVSAENYDSNQAGVLSASNLKLSVKKDLGNSGGISAAGLVDLQAQNLNNRGDGSITGNAVNLVMSGNAYNAGTLTAKGFLGFSTGGDLVNDGALKATDIALQVGQQLANGNTIEASGTLAASSNTFVNKSGASIRAYQIGLTVAGQAGNAGTIQADTLVFQAEGLSNAGSADHVAVLSARSLTINVADALGNEPNSLINGGDLAAVSAKRTNLDLFGVNGIAQGQFAYGRDLAVSLGDRGFTVAAGQRFDIKGRLYLAFSGDITINGALTSKGDMALISGGNLTNTAGIISAGGSLGIKIGGTLTNTRTPQATEDLGPVVLDVKIQEKNVVKERILHYETSYPAYIVAGGDLSIEAGAIRNDASVIQAGGVLYAKAGTIDNLNRESGVKYRYFLAVVGSGELPGGGWEQDTYRNNTAVFTGQSVVMSAGRLTNTGLIIGDTISIQAGTIVNASTSAIITSPTSAPNGTIELTNYATGGRLSGQNFDSGAQSGSVEGDEVGPPGVVAGRLDQGAGFTSGAAGGRLGRNIYGYGVAAGLMDRAPGFTPGASGGWYGGSLNGYASGFAAGPLDQGAGFRPGAIGGRLGRNIYGYGVVAGPLDQGPDFAPGAIGGALGGYGIGGGRARGGRLGYGPYGLEDNSIAGAGVGNAKLRGGRVDANLAGFDAPSPAQVGGTTYRYPSPFADGSEPSGPAAILARAGGSALPPGVSVFADQTMEQRLIGQALLDQTGSPILDQRYRNPRAQQEALYQGTVAFLQANPDIHLGDSLSAEQKARLTQPVLWYEQRNIDGQPTLAPQLLLPPGRLAEWTQQAGGVIQGNTVFLSGDQITNTGSLLASGTMIIDAGTFLNERRVGLGSGLFAQNVLQPGGVVSAGDLAIFTRGDLIDRGGVLQARNDLTLSAGGDILIAAQAVTNTSLVGNRDNWIATASTISHGALVAAGGDLTVLAGGALSVLGSTVTAGGDALLAARGPITIASALDSIATTAFARRDGLFSSSRTLVSQTGQINVPSLVAAGGNLAVVSGSDITVQASHLVAGGDLGVRAAGSLSVLAGEDLSQTILARRSSGLGLFGGDGGLDFYQTRRTTGSVTQATNAPSTLVAGGNATVIAGLDVNIVGSAIGAGQQMTLGAGRDLTIAPGFDRTVMTYARSVSGVGIGVSANDNGASVWAGYHSRSSLQAKDSTTAVASLVAGGSGVLLDAGRDATLTAADLVSGGDLAIRAGRDLSVLSQAQTEHDVAIRRQSFAGIRAGISQNVSRALDELQEASRTFNSGYGGDGYRAIGAVSGTLKAVDAVMQLTNPSVSASLTVGASSSTSRSEQLTETQRPGTIRAAGGISLEAGRDLHLQGTQVLAGGWLDLMAGRDMVIESARSRGAASQSASSWNAAVGIGAQVGLGGPSVGFTAEGSVSSSRSREQRETNTNAQLGAGDGISVHSGQDTTIEGARLSAPEIDLEVGRNLTVASRQDTATGRSSSSSLSGSIGPSSGSVSVGGSQGSSDRAWVGEQTAIEAGDRLSVTVGGQTLIRGALLNSRTGNLFLETGTLWVEDMFDHDTGRRFGLTLGLNGNWGGSGDQPAVGTISGSYAAHDRERVDRGTIGAGTIVLRDPAQQVQELAAINRDPSRAQVITRDRKEGVDFYGSSSAVREIGSGFEGTRQGLREIGKQASQGFPAFLAGVADAAKTLTKGLGPLPDTHEPLTKGAELSSPALAEFRQQLVAQGASPEAVEALVNNPAFATPIQDLTAIVARGANEGWQDQKPKPIPETDSHAGSGSDGTEVQLPELSVTAGLTYGQQALMKLGEIDDAMKKLPPDQLLAANITLQIMLNGPLGALKAYVVG